MKRCIIVGKANVGKTLFLIALAESLRVKEISIIFETPDGKKMSSTLRIEDAVNRLVGVRHHLTRCLQSVILDLPAGKGRKEIEFIDTTGLSDGIHHDSDLRKSMAQTLAALRSAHMILHILDAADIGRGENPLATGGVDREICDFARFRCSYCIIANKMDLPEAEKGLEKIIHYAPPGGKVFPVSALKRQGLTEVKRYVTSQI
ncbi:MAG: GTP-binding protein HSR1 [Firmicutes bacterium]|nr:GTP-binding protein HSR1 [Bacillota bacterium]